MNNPTPHAPAANSLAERITRLEKLDAERTPGEWIAGCHPANERLNIVKPIFFGKYVGQLPECEGGAMYMLHRPNAEYIAAMPDALSIIHELQGMLDVAREALEWYGEEILTYAVTQMSEPRSAAHADAGRLAREALAATNLTQPMETNDE